MEDGSYDKYDPNVATVGGLTVVGVDHESGANGSEYYDPDWFAVAMLRDPSGRLVAVEGWRNERAWGSMGSVKVTATEPPTISMEEKAGMALCGPSGEDIVEIYTTWVLRAVGGEIEVVSQTPRESIFDCPEVDPNDPNPHW